MAIKEMKMSFARDDACFQASNSETCLQQVMISHQEPRLLSSACEMICNRTSTDGELASFGHLGPLNLFVATSGKAFLCNNNFTTDYDLQQSIP